MTLQGSNATWFANLQRSTREALGPRGSVTGVFRLSGDRLVCSGNFVVELKNGHLTDVHRTHEHQSLAEVLNEVNDAAEAMRG